MDAIKTARAIGTYAATLRDFRMLAIAVPDGDWSAPTDLPGWTVQDVFSHVAGIESDLLGRPAVGHTPDFGALPYVQDPFAQYVEVAVDARRSWSPAKVRADLVDVIDERLLLLDAGEVEANGPAVAFFGSMERLLVMRPFDVWVHEQDVRRATGRPGNLAGTGAHVTAAAIRSMLPYVVGKRVKPQPGSCVRWTVTGELAFVDTVFVDGDGRAVLAPDYAEEPTVTLSATWEAFALIASGRAAAVAPTVTGDKELAALVLDQMTVTP